MIAVTETTNGVILPVRAQPGARREGIVGEQAGALKVAVTAPPDRGRANEAIIEVLADSLGVAKSSITLLSGPTSRQKKFLLEGLTLDEVNAWLQRLLSS
ncbi:MAG: DUF167 domain-containing protein [Aureliella sp.]